MVVGGANTALENPANALSRRYLTVECTKITDQPFPKSGKCSIIPWPLICSSRVS